MDGAFTKPNTARLHFLPTTILHNIQSSSGGQNKIITSEIIANPLLLHKC